MSAKTKRKKIVSVTLYQGKSAFMTLEIVGGPSDGLVWRTYDVCFNDGSKKILWKADGRDDFYIQAFVPWDLEHPSIL